VLLQLINCPHQSPTQSQGKQGNNNTNNNKNCLLEANAIMLHKHHRLAERQVVTTRWIQTMPHWSKSAEELLIREFDDGEETSPLPCVSCTRRRTQIQGSGIAKSAFGSGF
jgi:hypothetical protein